MTDPKLISILIFGALSFIYTVGFLISLTGVTGAIVSGFVLGGVVIFFIWRSQTGRQAFARGFLGLGATFIIVPIALLSVFGTLLSEESIAALEAGQLTDVDTRGLFVASILASAGLVFGFIVGTVLILIGGLMHLPRRG